MKLVDSLIISYATVYGYCSQEVKDKLKGSDDWERIQSKQLLHELIQKTKRICMGFDDNKKEVFNFMLVWTQIKERGELRQTD
jgi:hypothetical protein